MEAEVDDAEGGRVEEDEEMQVVGSIVVVAVIGAAAVAEGRRRRPMWAHPGDSVAGRGWEEETDGIRVELQAESL